MSAEQPEVIAPWDESDYGGYVFVEAIVTSVTPKPRPNGSAAPAAGSGPFLIGTRTGNGCSACDVGTSSATSGGSAVGVYLQFSLGQETNGYAVDSLRISSAKPTPELTTPGSLLYSIDEPNVEIINVSNQIRQIKAPQALADIITNNAFSYEIRYYLRSQIGSKVGGIYQLSGSPFVTWKIENPDGSPSTYNRLRITETRAQAAKIYDYTYTASSGSWKLDYPGGLREDEWSSSIILLTNILGQTYYIRTVTNTVRAPGGPDQFKVRRIYQKFGDSMAGFEALIEESLSPDSNPRTTTYAYYEDQSAHGPFRPLKLVKRPDGSWNYYEYDGLGRTTSAYSGFADDPAPTGTPDYYTGRRTTYDYSPVSYDDPGTNYIYTPRTTIEYLQGNEVSRGYTIILPGERRDIRCQRSYANPADGDNLVTVTKYYTSGSNTNRVRSIENPDGTMVIYEYAQAADGSQTNTVYSGQPNAGRTAIVDGTKDVTILGPLGQTISHTVTDIASAIVTFRETYDNYDELNRSQTATYLDGTTNQTYYACCGVDLTIDRDGVMTQYFYDAMKRQTATTRLNITTTNVLDAVGRTIKTIRIGSDGSPITLGQWQYNLAGEAIAETNALGGYTSYVETTDAATGGRIQVIINPDGGTVTNFYYVDGGLKKVLGTAVHGTRYTNGVEYTGDSFYTWSQEIKLDEGGNDTAEWTRTYSDMLGRNCQTVFPDGALSQSFYNEKSQLTNEVDPDAVATLFQFNAKGELEFTALDVNQDGGINWDGNDRITRTVSDVTTDNSANVHRTRTYVWSTDGSTVSNLVSVSETSVDGLRSWQTQYRDASTPVTSQSRTVYSGNNRYVTNTAPDGSYTVSAFSDGRLSWIKQCDASGGQIRRTDYAYDTHGRQSTATDARNGATTYANNNADLISSITTPNPGSGGSAQTTTTYYNKMLQATNVVQPDGTSVFSEYLLTGELKKTYGSRTYPVEYTHDYAGRMRTMKTWRDYPNSGTAVTTWNYDLQRGWLTNKVYDTDPVGVMYGYTPAGRLAARKWARTVGGQPLTTTYSHDNTGSLTNVSYNDGVTSSLTNTYDRRGRLIEVGTRGSVMQNSYNNADELLAESFTSGTLAGFAITNAYDACLRRAAVALNSQPSTLSQFGYDTASRLSSVTNANTTATYSYLANSPLISQITFRSNGLTRMTTTKAYDYLNRLTSISSLNSQPSTINSFAYAYNSANQRTAVTNADKSRWLYAYDALGQVSSGKKYWKDGTLVAGQQFEYTFDDIGNRTQTKTGGDANGANLREAGYTANSLNQYTSRGVPGYVDIFGVSFATNTVTVNGGSTYRKWEYFRNERQVDNGSSALWTNIVVAATGQTSITGNVFVAKSAEAFGYDADGNTTNDGRWAFTWDAENRLIQVESLNSSPNASKRKVVWEYDGKGRRIRQTTSDKSGGADVVTEDLKFVSDGWRHIAELNATNNALVRSYVWGLDLSGTMDGAGGVGGLLMVNSAASGTHFCAYDGNGNVAALANAANGTASAHCEYDPFGQIMRSTGPVAKENPFRFSTKRTDNTTDFVLYEYRPYDPGAGRWLSRDPSGEVDGGNSYRFVRNDTVSIYDVYGLWGDSVHQHLTTIWALENGYPEVAALAIGAADRAVDSLEGGTSPIPGVGDQSYHFNRNLNGGLDSRWFHNGEHMLRARRACNRQNDDPETAADELGTALHPMQDWVAHGDYNMRNSGPILEIHNSYSPVPPAPGWPSNAELPDTTYLDAVDGPYGRPAGRALLTYVYLGMRHEYAVYEVGYRRIFETRELTFSQLLGFQNYVRLGGGCRCRQYFGIE